VILRSVRGIDASSIGKGHDGTDTGNCHQPTADGIASGQLSIQAIEALKFLE
jgi:hypothetical protein